MFDYGTDVVCELCWNQGPEFDGTVELKPSGTPFKHFGLPDCKLSANNYLFKREVDGKYNYFISEFSYLL